MIAVIKTTKAIFRAAPELQANWQSIAFIIKLTRKEHSEKYEILKF